MPAGTRSSNGQAPFYIYNNDGGKGFVIVSGDDAIGTILGYSDHGTFTFKDAPDNLLFWMKTYAKRIAAIRADEKTEERMAEAPHPVVNHCWATSNGGRMHLTTMTVRHGQMGRTRIITTWVVWLRQPHRSCVTINTHCTERVVTRTQRLLLMRMVSP